MSLIKKLIVNADDCNLTEGVTEAICKAHQEGIVSSTTFMVNLPVNLKSIQKLAKQSKLGVGLHLNVSFGYAVSPQRRVDSLVDASGLFFRNPRPLFKKKIQSKVIKQEYLAQILLFKKIFKQLPTHLDTHHQLHDDPYVLRILTSIAKEWKLPIRRSHLMNARNKSRLKLGLSKIKTSDYLHGSLNIDEYWRAKTLQKTLKELPYGLNEVMCHPGIVDHKLREVSSFTLGREKERQLFSNSKWRNLIERENIKLTHYGICYT